MRRVGCVGVSGKCSLGCGGGRVWVGVIGVGFGLRVIPFSMQPSDDTYRVGMCSSVGPHYDPTGNGPTNRDGYNVSCTPDTPDGCEIGDLTGKHDTINISGEPWQWSSCTRMP